MFGKVDMEWVYPYKISMNVNIDMSNFIDETINNYMKFLLKIKLFTPTIEVYVLGIHLPCLENNAMLKNLNHQPAINDVSLKCSKNYLSNKISFFNNIDSLDVRIINTLKFNHKLEQECINNNFNYLEITDELFDDNRKYVQNKFINVEHPYGDHHLKRDITGTNWINKYKHIMKN